MFQTKQKQNFKKIIHTTILPLNKAKYNYGTGLKT